MSPGCRCCCSSAGLLSLMLVPAVNAFSRRAERAADRFAWETTGNADAFASAMQRLGAQNFAEERPSRLVRWLFYTHPPFDGTHRGCPGVGTQDPGVKRQDSGAGAALNPES